MGCEYRYDDDDDDEDDDEDEDAKCHGQNGLGCISRYTANH